MRARSSRTARAVAVAATLSLLAAACGGDDDDDASDSTGASDSSEPESTEPESTEPESTEPESTEPESTEPESTEPESTEPESTEPESDGADVAMAGPCDATVPGTQIDYGLFVPSGVFDPVGASGSLVGGTEVAAVYDVLFRFDPETRQVEPRVAEAMTPNNDELTEWTLTLRPGITYSDGTPLTAQLVSENIDRYFGDDVRNGSGGFLSYIAEHTPVDDLNLQLTMTQPVAQPDLFFADEPGMIVNISAIGDDLDAFRAQPPDAAGLGPYVVERNSPGEEIVLTARQDYWAGPVCVETLRMVYVPGAPGTYAAFESGELNMTFLRDPTVNQEAIDAGYQHFFYKQDGGSTLNLNHRDGRITADPRVREAVMLAIDPTVINDRAYNGNLDLSNKATFGEDSYYYSDAVEPFPLDPERAAALVEEVKSEGWDGSLNYVASSDGVGPDIALAIEAMLTSVGIDLQVESMPTGESISRLVSGDFDMIGNGMAIGPGTAVMSMLRNLSSTSPSNRMGYVSEAMDALLAEALSMELTELAPTMAQVNNLINEEFVTLSFTSFDEGAIWADEVSGITPTMSSIFLFHGATVEE